MFTQQQIDLLRNVVQRSVDEAEYQLNEAPFLHSVNSLAGWRADKALAEEALAILEDAQPVEPLSWLESVWLMRMLNMFKYHEQKYQRNYYLPCVGESFEALATKLQSLFHKDYNGEA